MLTGMPTVRNVRATDPRNNYPITVSPSIPYPMIRSDYDRTVTAGVNHNNVYLRAIQRKYVTLCMRHVTDTVMHISDLSESIKTECYDRAVALVSSQTLRSGALRYRGCINPITRKVVA